MLSETMSVRDLRRQWKPIKNRLKQKPDGDSTAIRIHRAFSWMAQAEENESDLDLNLVYRWIAFNALYGQWVEESREPAPDKETWGKFVDRILALDSAKQIEGTLIEHKKLVMTLLDDEYLSRFYWKDPTDQQAKKSKKLKYKARTWYLEKRWALIMDKVMERIYLIRCQLMHGAATHNSKLNRTSLKRCSIMLGHLLQAFIVVIIDNGADEDWGVMCYPPMN